MKNREQKIKIAVSGGFDPLHRGHVRLFKEAKKLGDKLIVILNNDNWLKAKKGYAFMPQEERKEIIGALAIVDEVALTNHPPNPKDMSVCAELVSLKPHIFANGGDRTLRNIPEVEVCEKIGCQMVFGVGQGGKVQSSSWLLEKHSKRATLAEKSRRFSAKKVVIFDLDGTLTESKAALDQEMASLLCRLLGKKKVMVIGGGNLSQFREQFLGRLACPKETLSKLFIAPTSGASMYKNESGKWQEIYRYTLSLDITKKGIGKAYGVRQIAKILKIPIKKMVYVGDALYEGGNDAVVKKTRISTIQVDGLEDAKFFVRSLLSTLDSN